jgi:hypothetical protein
MIITAAETKQIILKEISAKWGKFFEQDLSSLKDNNDLVTQLAAKHGCWALSTILALRTIRIRCRSPCLATVRLA